MIKDSNFRALYEFSEDAIMLLDETSFLHCNDATLRIFDCPSIELFCTKHPSDISPQYQLCGMSSLNLSQAYITDAITRGHRRFDWLHQRLSGEQFYTEVLLSPVVWNGRDVLQAVVRDISPRKRLEEQLMESRDQALQATHAKSEFLAVMSHEIRTPIHGIIASQELLQQSTLNEDQEENVLLSLHSAQNLLSTINNILDFSKIEAGKMESDNISFNPAQLISGVYDLLFNKANEKQLAFNTTMNHHNVESILGDVTKIRQIITNLVANAIKFTPQGNVTIDSQITVNSEDRAQWQLSITDTGIGINESQLENIFDRFTQADISTTREFGGTGLGLSISHALAEFMGGSISVTSTVNQGSRFTFKLPVAITHDHHPLPDSTQQQLQRNYQKRFLVAEDNPVNQVLITKHLNNCGVEVVMADNGLHACEIIETDTEQAFDLILMDIQMPKLNGIEASKRIRQQGVSTPILALTADAIEGRKEACIQAGMNGFLTKPFSQKNLINELDRFIHCQNSTRNSTNSL